MYNINTYLSFAFKQINFNKVRFSKVNKLLVLLLLHYTYYII